MNVTHTIQASNKRSIIMSSEQNSGENGEAQSTSQVSVQMKQETWEEIEHAREIEHYYQMNKHQEWTREQAVKAPKIVALLRDYIPPEHLQEVEDFLSTPDGCDRVREILV
jgi:hypothetical protein